MAFQTLSQIRALLEQAGLRPDKRRGQHFLIDRNLMQKLVDSAEIAPDDTVLEIGCGTGSLTNMLAERAGHVVAVELDESIAAIARSALEHHTNVTILVADALARKNRLNPLVIDALRASHQGQTGTCLLVANLPYEAASPIVANLLIDYPEVTRLCFTVQKELADRMLAQPATADYGPLTLIVQALGKPRRVAKVPRQAFWPMPKVDSAIVRIDACPEARAVIGDVHAFASVIHSLFLHRRKTLWQNLRLAYGQQAESIAARVGIDWRRRPEELAVAEWIDLAKKVPPPEAT